MYRINETRKEDEFYFKGPFWCLASSVDELNKGNYILLCDKELCSYEGELNRKRLNKENQTHEKVWENYKQDYENVPYNYFPRGRVEVYKGKAYINLNSILNKTKIIDDIRKEYQVDKLYYEVFNIDELQDGGHYSFLLK